MQPRSRSRHTPKATETNAKVGCRALILVDGSQRRRLERQRYEKSCRDLNRQTTRLRLFESEEVPAFHLWIEQELAEPLRQLRELQDRLSEIQSLAADTAFLAELLGITQPAAYQRLMAAKEAGTLEQFWASVQKSKEGPDLSDEDPLAEDPFNCENSDFDSNWESDGWDDNLWDDDGFHSSSQGHGYGQHSSNKRPGASSWPGGEHHDGEQNGDLYLKKLYRQLVRVLHPDTNPNPQITELWQKVQEAYAWKDVEALQRLSQIVLKRDDQAIDLNEIPISDIMGLCRSVEARLKTLRRNLRQAKKHPAWGFISGPKTQHKKREIKRTLLQTMAADSRILKIHIEMIEQEMASWSKVKIRRDHKQKPAKPSPRRKRSAGHSFRT